MPGIDFAVFLRALALLAGAGAEADAAFKDAGDDMQQ